MCQDGLSLLSPAWILLLAASFFAGTLQTRPCHCFNSREGIVATSTRPRQLKMSLEHHPVGLIRIFTDLILQSAAKRKKNTHNKSRNIIS